MKDEAKRNETLSFLYDETDRNQSMRQLLFLSFLPIMQSENHF